MSFIFNFSLMWNCFFQSAGKRSGSLTGTTAGWSHPRSWRLLWGPWVNTRPGMNSRKWLLKWTETVSTFLSFLSDKTDTQWSLLGRLSTCLSYLCPSACPSHLKLHSVCFLLFTSFLCLLFLFTLLSSLVSFYLALFSSFLLSLLFSFVWLRLLLLVRIVQIQSTKCLTM